MVVRYCADTKIGRIIQNKTQNSVTAKTHLNGSEQNKREKYESNLIYQEPFFISSTRGEMTMDDTRSGRQNKADNKLELREVSTNLTPIQSQEINRRMNNCMKSASDRNLDMRERNGDKKENNMRINDRSESHLSYICLLYTSPSPRDS